MLDSLAASHVAQLKDPKSPFTKDEDREYILRFFALFNNLKDLKPPLYKFLNAEIHKNQFLKDDVARLYRNRFKNSFELVSCAAKPGACVGAFSSKCHEYMSCYFTQW